MSRSPGLFLPTHCHTYTLFLTCFNNFLHSFKPLMVLRMFLIAFLKRRRNTCKIKVFLIDVVLLNNREGSCYYPVDSNNCRKTMGEEQGKQGEQEHALA